MRMRSSPLTKQILIFGILSGMISLFLALAGFGIVEFYKIKNESTAKLSSQMDILAYNLQPTLLFDDKDAANKILLSLKDDESINNVRVYDEQEQEFASLVRDYNAADIKRAKIIYYEGRPAGRIEIEAINLGIRDRYISYLLISLLIIMITIPASYLISGPIRRQVSLSVVKLEQQSDRLRMLADQVSATEQKERKRIAAIIHDHLQQILVASKIHIGQALRALKNQEYARVTASINRGEGFLNDAIQAAKSLTVELRPPVLYEDGLGPAFQWLANRFKNDHDFTVVLHLEEVPESLPDNLKIMIFESVKELLFNVIKYAGVHRAELFLAYRTGAISICIKDRGRGFDVEHVEKASADKGFGLFNIRERLKLLNGSLQIVSRQNGGTEVKISIPFDAVEIPQQRSLTRKEIRSHKDPHERMINILLADDHKIVREGIANLLKENRNFNVVAQAENGIEAVEKAATFQPDVVIMDINMPKLNGIEATRAIKNKFSDMDIIGLSVQDEVDVTASMKKAGAVTLLNKAGDPQQLIMTILSLAGK